jgi:MFS family permease
MTSPRPESGVDADAGKPVRGMRLPRGLSAFKHRNYRLFFSGQLISVTGTWMQSLAQAWLVLTLTDSPLQFSLVNVCQFAPVLVLAIAAGVAADHFPKRNVLLVTQSLSGLLAATLAILVATDSVELWHVYALALGLGIVNAFDMPTRQSFVVEMVGREDLMNGIALNSSLFNVGRIIGPAIAGLLLATQGPALCFGLNAVSYIAVIAGLLMMRLQPVAIAREGTGLQRMREGFSYVKSSPAILMPMTLVALIAIFGLNFNVWIPLLAKKEFDVGADGFGILMSALGLGSLTGALFLAFSGRGPRPQLILITGAILGIAEVAMAIAAVIPLHVSIALVILPLMGFAMSTTNAMANTIVQTASPQHMRGRVMSVYMTFFAGTAPLGAFLAGLIADRLGTPASLAFGGSISLAAAIGVAVYFGAWRSNAPAMRFTTPGLTDVSVRAAQSGSRD